MPTLETNDFQSHRASIPQPNPLHPPVSSRTGIRNSRQNEFVYVLQGEAELQTDAGMLGDLLGAFARVR